MKRIKKTLDFGLLVTLMQKNSKVILCGDSDDDPTIELVLEPDDVPDDLYEAIARIEGEWEFR